MSIIGKFKTSGSVKGVIKLGAIHWDLQEAATMVNSLKEEASDLLHQASGHLNIWLFLFHPLWVQAFLTLPDVVQKCKYGFVMF